MFNLPKTLNHRHLWHQLLLEITGLLTSNRNNNAIIIIYNIIRSLKKLNIKELQKSLPTYLRHCREKMNKK